MSSIVFVFLLISWNKSSWPTTRCQHRGWKACCRSVANAAPRKCWRLPFVGTCGSPKPSTFGGILMGISWEFRGNFVWKSCLGGGFHQQKMELHMTCLAAKCHWRVLDIHCCWEKLARKWPDFSGFHVRSTKGTLITWVQPIQVPLVRHWRRLTQMQLLAFNCATVQLCGMSRSVREGALSVVHPALGLLLEGSWTPTRSRFGLRSDS